MSSRADLLEAKLKNQFQPLHFELEDESHQHRGRAGQESHFKLLMVAEAFRGQSRVDRQRSVLSLLQTEFQTGLHALTLRLLSPDEWEAGSSAFSSPSCQSKPGSGRGS